MEERKINVSDSIMDILNNPNLHKAEDYIKILEKTSEFSSALSDIFSEVYTALEDGELTVNEIRKIGVKMFSFLVMLKNKNFKFDGLSKEEGEQLKELVKDHLDEILTNLVVKAIRVIKEKSPEIGGMISERDIELVVGTIVDTANFSIEIISDNCSRIFPCCN